MLKSELVLKEQPIYIRLQFYINKATMHETQNAFTLINSQTSRLLLDKDSS